VREGALGEPSDAQLAAAVERANLPAASLSYLFLRRPGADGPWAYDVVGQWPPVDGLDDGQRQWVDGVADALSARGRSAPRSSGGP
jgi:hypothetical protein